MGVVYLARQCSLKRTVALKMILAGPHADARARTRFRTEAEAVAQLQHPNIVQVHEIGESDGTLFVAFEHIEGGSLLRKIAGRPMEAREAAGLVEVLGRAVEYTHQRGILHRDLKPSNVLLTADGTPKITDFGLAKILHAETGHARSETWFGTPSYMAPEQIEGSAGVSAPCDVYALGAILYELLTGRAPFQGATPLSTLEQVRTQEPVAPRQLRRSVPADLEAICLKCLEKQPAKRYATAEALVEDLHRFREGQAVKARVVAGWRRLARRARHRPALIAWVVCISALACLLLTAAAYYRAASHLAGHHAEQTYRLFVVARNEALFHGFIAADTRAASFGLEPPADVMSADAAAGRALALAGANINVARIELGNNMPAALRTEVTRDCYTLLLVMAGVRSQQSRADETAGARIQAALRLLDQARALGIETQAFHLRRALLLEQLGRRDEARREWDSAASLAPTGVLDHFLAGEDASRRGASRDAIGSFNRALALQPDHFWSQFLLAVCHLKQADWNAARTGLNACVAWQPDFVWAYLFRSFANEKLGAGPEAESDLRAAYQRASTPDARYALLLMRGNLRLEQHEIERAAADFCAAIDLKPRQYNAYLNLAQVELAQGDRRAAERHTRIALQLEPPVPVVAAHHLQRGRMLLADGRHEEAIEACTAALVRAPGQAMPHEVQGRALLAMERYCEAEREFDRYLAAGGVATTNLFRSRGLARMKRGRYLEAVDDYSRALELAPDADIYEHRGWAHFFCDAWKLADRDFCRAIELNPGTKVARVGRGLARVMLGDYVGAAADADAGADGRALSCEMTHNVACIFAQAVVHAEADARETNRRALAAKYRARAFAAIRQTLALLAPSERAAFWNDTILTERALTPIRKDLEFRELDEQFGRHR
jgi:tetratricopeptide (TPR) repeat protein